MATYKVPQDVEAEDKLLGPFSFRQFIYLIIAALSIALAWGLAQIFIGFALIPVPIILLFGVLALPLKKDQPMEIYLAAIISFYRKPHKRVWDPDGIESLVEITAPKTVEVQLTKDISQNEAEERFSYLAGIVDSQGWAVRGQGVEAPNNALTSDAYYAAQQAQDVLEQGSTVAQSFDYMINQSDVKRHEEMLARMRNPAAAPVAQTPVMQPQQMIVTPAPAVYAVPVQPVQPQQYQPQVVQQPAYVPQTPVQSTPVPVYNPYPSIQQSVIQPANDPAHQAQTTPAPSTSEKTVSPDIMKLANNADLSIETIAREANRLQQKQDDLQEEVVISLR